MCSGDAKSSRGSSSDGKRLRARLLSGRIALISMHGPLTKPGSEWHELAFRTATANVIVRSLCGLPINTSWQEQLAPSHDSARDNRWPRSGRRVNDTGPCVFRELTNAALRRGPPATIDHVTSRLRRVYRRRAPPHMYALLAELESPRRKEDGMLTAAADFESYSSDAVSTRMR
ncbi:hypothetical protein HPB50_004458 [Hyalomma asiaticum]|uniref:Uncharacterized protein n=1 Tax=Hyalomma asiaticum TaxID=266040 RepID=A0ACB7TEK1_HYAAI|nr:hypothetical protein HPB50_004458 [Hyalomma asiaticum]